MIQFDYYNKEIKLNDLVYIDNKPTHRNKGRVIGFTKQKTKLYNIQEDKINYIYPSNLTVVKTFDY